MLLLLFIIPFIASIIAFLSKGISKGIAFFLSLIPLLFLIWNQSNILEASCNYDWVPTLSIRFHLGVDALSRIFLYIICVIVPISILSEKSATIYARNFFYGLILLLQGLLIGFFTARDLFVFTFFWEAMLIPLYFLINMWGGKERQNAAFKFIIYMVAGSTLMVLAVLSLYFSVGTFDIATLMKSSQTIPFAPYLFFVFLIAFAVKTPLFPFHAWLPDSYCQSSTAGTILLAAVLSKAGIYGILRIGYGFFPTLLLSWSPILLCFAVIGVLYGAFAAWGQNDFKRLIAYSSLSHVNFILAGLFVYNEYTGTGSILQSVNHAVTVTGLFLVVGWLSERLDSTLMGSATGIAKYVPRLAWITLFFVLSAVALPGLNNFVSEVLILFGVFIYNPWFAGTLGLTVILSVIYSLRFYQSIYFGTANSIQKNWVDLSFKEVCVTVPLIALILWLGIYPKPVLLEIEPFAKQLLGMNS